MQISNEKLLQTLRTFFDQYGNSPRKNDFSNNTTYQRRFGSWNKALAAAGLPITIHHEIGNSIETICTHCSNKFIRAKSQLNSSGNNFCSSSCSAQYSNTHRISTTKKTYNYKSCKICKIPSGKAITCKSCRDQQKINLGTRTIQEMIYNKSAASRYGLIRFHARSVSASKILNGCQNCSYNHHVEVCHIKAICDFTTDTILNIVNDPSNLIILCPNCHWDLDHGLLKL